MLGHTRTQYGIWVSTSTMRCPYRNAPKFDLSGSAIISGSRFACVNDRQVTTNCQGVANGGSVGGFPETVA